MPSSNNLDRFLSENNENFRDTPLQLTLQRLYTTTGLSKAALAKQSGISEVYLHQLFSGCRFPSRNRHHFEYWIDYCRREDGTIYIGGCKMPKKYVAEMFCDRIAACRVYQGDAYTDASPYDYYQRSKDLRRTDASRFMHPETAALLDRWLLLLKERGEEAAFAAIRAELADSAY